MRSRIIISVLIFCGVLLAQEVKILSYNVFLRPGAIGWSDYKQERFAELADAVRPYDIIGLCEVFDDDLREKWKSLIYTTHPYQIDPPETNNPFLQDGGITFFSRYPIVFHKKMIFDDAAGWDAMAEKGVIFARIEQKDGTLLEVALTHTQADANQFEVRKKQLDQMQQFIEQNKEDHPLFIMGDFNVIGDKGDQYQDMLQRFQYPNDLYRFGKSDPGYTYHGTENPLTEEDCLERLDYIFLHDFLNRIQVQSCNVMKFPMKNPVDKVKYMSDHYAIETTITTGQPIYRIANKITAQIEIIGENLTKEIEGEIVLQDSSGERYSQEFSMEKGMELCPIVFEQITPGRAVVKITIENRITHHIIELNSEKINITLPLGTVQVDYLCPEQWLDMPVTLTLSGPFCGTWILSPGKKTKLVDLPTGNYRVSMQIGRQIFTQKVKWHDYQQIRLEKLFDFSNKQVITGKLPQDFSGTLDLVTKDAVFPVFLQEENYRAIVSAGQYYLLWKKNGKAHKLYPLEVKTMEALIDKETKSLSFNLTNRRENLNHFIIQKPEESNGILIINQGAERYLPERLSRRQLISLKSFTWMPFSDTIELEGYPQGQYQFYFYIEKENFWFKKSIHVDNVSDGKHTIIMK